MKRSIVFLGALAVLGASSLAAQTARPPAARGTPAPDAPMMRRGGPPAGMPRAGFRMQGGMQGGGPAVPGAAFLLSRTGPLQLTDAQVVKLAAIARRAEARRVADRARLDSLATQMRAARTDSAVRARIRASAPFGPAEMEKRRDAEQADLRDAIAVLTADQQAKAWEMLAAGGRGLGPMAGRGPGMARGRGWAPGGPGMPGARRMPARPMQPGQMRRAPAPQPPAPPTPPS